MQNIELLNTNFKDTFHSLAKNFTYKKGTTPFSQKELQNYFFILLDGKIRTYRLNLQNLKEQTFFIYKRGDMFDVATILDGKPHDTTYEVLEDAKVARFPIEVAREWLKSSEEFAKMFYDYVASHLKYLEDQVAQISLYDVKDRLVDLLLKNMDKDDTLRFNLLQNLSNTQVASLLGSVRTVLEKNIAALKDEGEVKTARKKIEATKKLLEKNSKMLPK